MGTEADLRRVLANYRTSPDYDDILQEARIAVWRVLSRPPAGVSPDVLARRAALWAAKGWLRGRAASSQKARPGRSAAPICVSLHSIPEPHQEDFANALIDEIANAQIIAALLAQAAPRLRDYIQRCFQASEPEVFVAADWGVTAGALRQELATACRRVRRALDVPEPTRRPGLPNGKKTHCPRGHLYEGENVIWSQGKRSCRECHRLRGRLRYRSLQDQHQVGRNGP